MVTEMIVTISFDHNRFNQRESDDVYRLYGQNSVAGLLTQRPKGSRECESSSQRHSFVRKRPDRSLVCTALHKFQGHDVWKLRDHFKRNPTNPHAHVGCPESPMAHVPASAETIHPFGEKRMASVCERLERAAAYRTLLKQVRHRKGKYRRVADNPLKGKMMDMVLGLSPFGAEMFRGYGKMLEAATSVVKSGNRRKSTEAQTRSARIHAWRPSDPHAGFRQAGPKRILPRYAVEREPVP